MGTPAAMFARIYHQYEKKKYEDRQGPNKAYWESKYKKLDLVYNGIEGSLSEDNIYQVTRTIRKATPFAVLLGGLWYVAPLAPIFFMFPYKWFLLAVVSLASFCFLKKYLVACTGTSRTGASAEAV